ncbi:MAG TPA: AMP-binding protein [Acidimicrobiales bacterium]
MSTTSDRSADTKSLRALVDERGEQRANDPYLLNVAGTEIVTYVELATRVQVLGSSWRSRGLLAKERVALIVEQPLSFSVAFLALLSAGAWVAPIDPVLVTGDPEQLRRVLARLRITKVVSDAPSPVSIDSEWWDVGDDDASNERAVLSEGNGSVDHTEEGGVVLSSSGTTGTPKIMELPMAQLLFVAANVARHNSLDEHERGFNPLPLWHINAEVVGLLATLVGGASLVLDDRFHRSNFWPTIEALDVTWINAVPAIIARLTPLRDGEVIPTRVRFVRSASAPLSPSRLSGFEDVTRIPIVESYGMTEAASQICVNPFDAPRKVGSVGRPVGVDLRVTPINSESTDGPVIGEVEIRGPSVIRRYEGEGYEDRFDADGWLHTRDLGYLDEDGYLFLVGRSDDVINRGGEKIFPREIEELVLDVDGVQFAAVVGIPDDVYGHVPVLFVQLDGVTSVTSTDEFPTLVKEIKDVLLANVARTRRPREISVVAVMPVLTTGKIKRKDLEAGLVDVLGHEPVQ